MSRPCPNCGGTGTVSVARFTMDADMGGVISGSTQAQSEPCQLCGGDGVLVPFIDEQADAPFESFTYVYTSDRDLLVRVRDGGRRWWQFWKPKTKPIPTFMVVENE